MWFASARLTARLLRLLRLGKNAKKILHVMADLMRDHVGLGELARFAADRTAVKTRRDLIEERGVEINLLIAGTIERTHGGLGAPTLRYGRPRYNTSTGGDRCRPPERKFAASALRAAEHAVDEAAHSSCGLTGAARVGGAWV